MRGWRVLAETIADGAPRLSNYCCTEFVGIALLFYNVAHLGQIVYSQSLIYFRYFTGDIFPILCDAASSCRVGPVESARPTTYSPGWV